MPLHNIQYLQRAAIDTVKWDQCISTAPNGLIYAASQYLDGMAPGEWNALVMGDYEAVMPVPFRKKMGIAYLFQPFLTPALGVFGKAITAEIVSLFLQQIPASFKLWDISLNYANPIGAGYLVFQRSNYVLALSRAYETLREGYSTNLRRNLRKAANAPCVLNREIPISTIIDMCKRSFPAFAKMEDGLFDRLEAVYNSFSRQAALYGVYDQKGKVLAAAAFLFYGQRACYWLVPFEEEGRAYNAPALLLDTFIKDHAGRDLLLDFEGSDVEGIAGFYQKFGAQPEPYYTIYRNLLPPPFKWFKPVPASYRDLVLISR